MKNKDLFFMVLLFYAGWFGSIFLAKTSFSFISLAFPILLLIFLYLKNNLSRKKIFYSLSFSVIGILFDFIMLKFDFITISGDYLLPLPVWLISIWLLFSFSMIKLAADFSPSIFFSILLGAIMGPISYKSGEAFQVLTFQSSITFFIYAVFWGAAFPLILRILNRSI